MYICICKQVTDKQIKIAIDEGARSMRDLRSELGVGRQCGQCCQYAQEILNQHTPRRSCFKQFATSFPVDAFPLIDEPLLITD